jgi:hypothetical protein
MICSGWLRGRFRMNGQILVVIASVAKQSREVSDALGCRVASLLAMTEGLFAPIITFSPSFSKEGLGWFLSVERCLCVFIPTSPLLRFSLTRAMLSHRHHPNPSSKDEGLTPLPFALSLSKCTFRTGAVLRQAQDERCYNHHHRSPFVTSPSTACLGRRSGQARVGTRLVRFLPPVSRLRSRQTVGVVTITLHPYIIVILNSFQDLGPLATIFRFRRPRS